MQQLNAFKTLKDESRMVGNGLLCLGQPCPQSVFG
jgi:hypothetical protein